MSEYLLIKEKSVSVSRPISIQTESILEAARKVFLAHGFRASTALIAREARISEGSLFKHFKTKDDLFLAAMDTEISGASWQDLLKRSVGRGVLRDTLETAGLQILQDLQIILPRIMMVSSSGIVLTGPQHCRGARVSPAIKKLRALAGYFRAEAAQGRLTLTTPEVHAQIFIGSLMHYVLQQTIFNYRPATPKAYVRTVVALILGGQATGKRKKPRITHPERGTTR
jgi:AcrR family transcriptional regulator